MIAADPGEMDDARDDQRCGEDWLKYMRKWTKKQKRGEITAEQLSDAFRAWSEKKDRELKEAGESGQGRGCTEIKVNR